MRGININIIIAHHILSVDVQIHRYRLSPMRIPIWILVWITIFLIYFSEKMETNANRGL